MSINLETETESVFYVATFMVFQRGAVMYFTAF